MKRGAVLAIILIFALVCAVWFFCAEFASGVTSFGTPSSISVVDTTYPLISFGVGTENSNAVSSNSWIYVNVSLTEVNFANITFKLYYSNNTIYSKTTYASETYTINWTDISSGSYKYNVTSCDDSGNCNSTLTFNIEIVSSCLSQCAETQNCYITSNCALYSGLCTGSSCDFKNMTVNAKVYTLYNGVNGNSLALNINGTIGFLSGNSVIFSGKNGSSFGSGSAGGSAGIVNITVYAGALKSGVFPPYNLLNTTSAMFIGLGGYSTAAGSAGGNGGVLQLNYWGILGYLGVSDPGAGGFEDYVYLTAGNSTSGTSGTSGSIIYNKELVDAALGIIYRDVDISDDGVVNLNDVALVIGEYNNVSTDAGFNSAYDINNDSRINVIDLVRVGFEYDRGA